MDNKNSIGIFDSGMGGISVLADCIRILPKENFIYYGDSKNAPYGIKTTEEVMELSENVCNYLIKKNVKAIVVACNTATSASINILRQRYNVPIIGMEPAIKPAIENYDGLIAVLATEVTLREKKFNNLLKVYGTNRKIVKIPCPNLVEIVENGIVDGKIAIREIEKCFEVIDISKISTIVLGCTHFVFLKSTIKSIVGNAINIIDGNVGTVNNLKSILKSNRILNTENSNQHIEFNNSGSEEDVLRSKKLLKIYSENAK
ncbi:glutamate racemase [Helicovermis profundi]|uniref:Glutamate racemase n=1 Tax=Helicovermis profundi TaxID=3065157 RepID=A0AAU9EML0_9FIRM|nr:glutamate racemase [Clostridia bacterium S502]